MPVCPPRTWRLYSLIMIRVHADLVALLGEGVLAVLDRPQLVVRLQVRPAPESAINHVRQTLAANTLNAVVADTARARPAKAQVRTTLLPGLRTTDEIKSKD